MTKLFEGMSLHAESYEHLGTVSGYVHDLREAWSREKTQCRTFVNEEDAWISEQALFPLSAPLVWDYLTEPSHLSEWCRLDSVTLEGRENGRLGVGTVCHTVQGAETTEQTFIDWRPFEYSTMETVLPWGVSIRSTTKLTQENDETKCHGIRKAGSEEQCCGSRLVAGHAVLEKKASQGTQGGSVLLNPIMRRDSEGKVAPEQRNELASG